MGICLGIGLRRAQERLRLRLVWLLLRLLMDRVRVRLSRLAWLALLMWLRWLVVTCLVPHRSTLGSLDFCAALSNGCVCR